MFNIVTDPELLRRLERAAKVNLTPEQGIVRVRPEMEQHIKLRRVPPPHDRRTAGQAQTDGEMNMEWQPIEKKPRNGVVAVLLYPQQDWVDFDGSPVVLSEQRELAERMVVAFFSNGEWFEAGTGHPVIESWKGAYKPAMYAVISPPKEK